MGRIIQGNFCLCLAEKLIILGSRSQKCLHHSRKETEQLGKDAVDGGRRDSEVFFACGTGSGAVCWSSVE